MDMDFVEIGKISERSALCETSARLHLLKKWM